MRSTQTPLCLDFVVSIAGHMILQVNHFSTTANCITGNVTLRSNAASGKMLLSDRRNSLSEEQHDEPEKQA
jgi:hypothetical protein